MALSDAIYVFDIEPANSYRGVYESLKLRIAHTRSTLLTLIQPEQAAGFVAFRPL